MNPVENEDVYRRHSNCRCLIDYSPDRSKVVQNVHDRQWRIAGAQGDIEARKRLKGIDEKKKKRADRIAELSQKNRGKKVMITDQAIEKVRKISFDNINAETADYIQSAHRELLRFARSENFSDEVVGIVDLSNNTRLHYIVGTKDSADPEADADYYHILHTAPSKTLLLCHNHPGLSYFSLNDISFFMTYDSIKTMTIVTNQGNVRYIAKTDKFDIFAARDCMYNAVQRSPEDPDKIVAYFLKNCYTYGVERN